MDSWENQVLNHQFIKIGGKWGNKSRLQMGVQKLWPFKIPQQRASWSLQIYTCHNSISKSHLGPGMTDDPRPAQRKCQKPQIPIKRFNKSPFLRFFTRFEIPTAVDICWHHTWQHPLLTINSSKPSQDFQAPLTPSCPAMCKRLQICHSRWSLGNRTKVLSWPANCFWMFYWFPERAIQKPMGFLADPFSNRSVEPHCLDLCEQYMLETSVNQFVFTFFTRLMWKTMINHRILEGMDQDPAKNHPTIPILPE